MKKNYIIPVMDVCTTMCGNVMQFEVTSTILNNDPLEGGLGDDIIISD